MPPTNSAGPGSQIGSFSMDGLRRILTDLREGRGSVLKTAATIGAIVALILLLFDNAGLAIVAISIVVPFALTIAVNRLDLFEREPRLYIFAAGVAGAIAGLFFGTIGTWLLDRLWLGDTVFNVGAAGFVGAEADGEGSAPFLVFLLVVLIIPFTAVVATLAGPLALRQLPRFRNELMDGVTLGAAAGGGFAAADTWVYYWPLISDNHARGDVADWTATLIGLIVLRPIIFAAVVGMAAAAVWHYARHARLNDILFPAIASLAGIAIYFLGVILLVPVGIRAELLWAVLAAIGFAWAGRRVLNWARQQDRQVASAGGSRVVCPNCGQPTPAGEFCAHCGHPLNAEAGASVELTATATTQTRDTAVIDDRDLTEPGTEESVPLEYEPRASMAEDDQLTRPFSRDEDYATYEPTTSTQPDIAESEMYDAVEPLAEPEPIPGQEPLDELEYLEEPEHITPTRTETDAETTDEPEPDSPMRRDRQ